MSILELPRESVGEIWTIFENLKIAGRTAFSWYMAGKEKPLLRPVNWSMGCDI